MPLRVESRPVGPVPSIDPGRAEVLRDRGVSDVLAPAFFVGGDPARRNLDRLLERGATCITTGQQPGLLTGPIYTIYKALSAVVLARRTEAAIGRPVVPVFWVAGDDHDFTEANHFHVSRSDGEIERVTLRERDAGAALTPLYREAVGPEIEAVLAALRDHTPDSEFRADILAGIERSYDPATDLASAFAQTLATLLSSTGLVVFQSTHRAAKEVIAPLLLRVLEGAATLDEALAERARILLEAGHDTPVPVGDGAAPVMLEGTLGRDRLTADGSGFATRRSGEAFTLAELARIAREEPQRLSPNVLLRPVVEAALLPTLGYVGGPSELAYLPQSQPLYDHLSVEPQAYVSRWAGRIVEGRVERILKKYDLTTDALEAPSGQLESALVADELPPRARESLDALRRALTTEYERLAESAEDVDPTLRRTVESAGTAALSGAADVEKRLLSHLKKRNAVSLGQIRRARAELYPLGQPQERVFNVVPYLIRYGTGLVPAVLDEAERWMGTLEPATSPP